MITPGQNRWKITTSGIEPLNHLEWGCLAPGRITNNDIRVVVLINPQETHKRWIMACLAGEVKAAYILV